jgi:hypothetical protein
VEFVEFVEFVVFGYRPEKGRNLHEVRPGSDDGDDFHYGNLHL